MSCWMENATLPGSIHLGLLVRPRRTFQEARTNLRALWVMSLSDEEAHTADADAFATGLLATALITEGVIPNDVEAAFAEQAEIQRMIDAEKEMYGRAIFPDRDDGRYRLGMETLVALSLKKPTKATLNGCSAAQI